MKSEEPVLRHLAVDDRGEVTFVNDFDFEGVKRSKNHQQGFVRAWHAHRREAKYVTGVAGAAIVGLSQGDDVRYQARYRDVWNVEER